MAVERRAGAPKLIAWTGERCVPWADAVEVAYEHYHRYIWAANLIRGRRVLDVGSGEGYGSAILAAEAASVQGIDIDEQTVAHSRLNYRADKLEFRVGSATDLSDFDDDAFDAVVAFEVVEHLVEQERMLEEIDRVLAPGGLLIISTPDRRMYSEATGNDNPFHERELSEPEFRALLATQFAHVGLWGQRTVCGSRIGALQQADEQRALTIFLERSGDDWQQVAEPPTMYLVAVASRTPFAMPPAESMLVDHGLQLLRAHEREAGEARQQLLDAHSAIRDVEPSLELEPELATQVTEEDEERSLATLIRIANHRHRSEVEKLTAQLAGAEYEVLQADATVAAAKEQLRQVEGLTWSAFQFVRWRLVNIIGEDSAASRVLRSAVRRGGKALTQRRARRTASIERRVPSRLIRFPLHDDPVASIVVAAHVGAKLTERCLRAIAANSAGTTYEVIVIDDAGDGDNLKLWTALEGARVIVNEHNLGYLRSVNRGAAQARGRYIVPLNNDTEVQPGWLEALVERAEEAADVGVVAPMLLYPDGTLQEAGAIIFSDATGWNYGRGQDPAHHRFNFVREIDYGSGACLLVRADLWHELGGYDELFEPMYYEDADLCFAARERGYRVLYEPGAKVVHAEGSTAGTDVGAGAKRHQALNRPRFADKWQAQLATQMQAVASPEAVREASDRSRAPRVLVVDHRVPFPDRDAGSLRMLHMVRSFVQLGNRVTFIPDNLQAPAPYTRMLQKLGVEVICGAADVGQEIASIAAQLRLAVLSRPVIAPRFLDVIRERAPDVAIAYDTVDLHFLREERRAALGQPCAAKAASLRELELGLVRGCDVTITVSEEERDVLASLVPGARIVVVPVVNEIVEDIAPPARRSGVLFVGSFEHPPNADATIALVRSVMPLVWGELGPVEVRIVGPHPPASVRELAGPDVEILGWVEDIAPLYQQARVMVAPLRYGAGMKGKVTQSLAAGLPVVTTPIGAEGLGAVDGLDLMIAEQPVELAERIVRLIREDELWRELSAAGLQLAGRVASPAVMCERLEGLLALPDTRRRLALGDELDLRAAEVAEALGPVRASPSV
jgi:GT2 family glycosyltransferase/SAM-dependent methyltransferase/glycosyltransferase involved in cell wall biosynthesis